MRVYRVEFEGMNSEFHHAAAESQVIKWGFANALTLSSLDLDTSITLNTEGFTGGWSQYPYVTITAHEYESYRCNCCLKEVPGDGDYVICYLCGWENEISDLMIDDSLIIKDIERILMAKGKKPRRYKIDDRHNNMCLPAFAPPTYNVSVGKLSYLGLARRPR